MDIITALNARNFTAAAHIAAAAALSVLTEADTSTPQPPTHPVSAALSLATPTPLSTASTPKPSSEH